MAVSWVAFQTQANDQFWFQLDFWARATQKRAQLLINSHLKSTQLRFHEILIYVLVKNASEVLKIFFEEPNLDSENATS